MPYDIFGEYYEHPKGQRKPGLTDMIREYLAERFPDFDFTVRLVGWGNKRGCLLYKITLWQVEFEDGAIEPSVQKVEYALEMHGWSAATEFQFQFHTEKKPGIEKRSSVWHLFYS